MESRPLRGSQEGQESQPDQGVQEGYPEPLGSTESGTGHFGLVLHLICPDGWKAGAVLKSITSSVASLPDQTPVQVGVIRPGEWTWYRGVVLGGRFCPRATEKIKREPRFRRELLTEKEKSNVQTLIEF